jgi:Domain of unknown function (DUF2427)
MPPHRPHRPSRITSRRTAMALFRVPLLSCILITLCASSVVAHEHEELPPGQVITFDPVDSILWTHIVFMTLSFGILFPTGMVSCFILA